MSFPKDIIESMKICILYIFWPKNKIYEFFAEHCHNDDLRCISAFNEMARHQIVDVMFSHLAGIENNIGQYRSMLKAITEWSFFDPYYFHKLKKLDEYTARQSIENLKKVVSDRDSKIKKTSQANSTNTKQQEQISKIRDQYFELLNPKYNLQARGYKLEQILCDLAKSSNLEVTKAFKIIGEQIDGAIKYDGEHYILEAKWCAKAESNESLYQMAHKVEGKFYGRGIFVSINGFSEQALRAITYGKSLNLVLIDGEDLMHVLEQRIDFVGMLDTKIRNAQTKGLIYVCPIKEKTKI